jgi:hypothetical protein
MKKLFFVSASLVLLSTQAMAQVRPGDCRPVFPVVDQVAELPPPPAVVTPPPVVQKRRYDAAWLAGGFVILAGLIVITHDHNHHHNNPVSPA